MEYTKDYASLLLKQNEDLTKYNSKLRQENDELRDRLNTMALALSDLNRKVEDTENEKLSLVTALKILHEEQANDFKDHSRADGWQKNSKANKARSNTTTNESTQGTSIDQLLTNNEEFQTAKKTTNKSGETTAPTNAISTNLNQFAVLPVHEISEHDDEVIEIDTQANSSKGKSVASLNEDIQPHNTNPKTNAKARRNQSKDNQVRLNNGTAIRGDSQNKSNIVLIGDSMVKNINPRKLSRKRVNKFIFPGKTAEEIASEIQNIGIQSPTDTTHVIIHAGTNNLPMNSSSECVKSIKGLCATVKEKFPDAKFGLSSIIQREDIDVSRKINEVNTQLERLCNELDFIFIDNSIIDESVLNGSKLHLNAKGSALLATRFIKFINPNRQTYNQTAAGNHIYSENFLRGLINMVALSQSPMLPRRRTR